MKVKAALLGMFIVALIGCKTVVPGATVEKGEVKFVAQGTSVVAKAGDDLSLIEAQVAACTLAKANLLEKIKGAVVANRVKVKGLMFEDQEAMTRMEGYLSRATVGLVPAPESKLGQPAIVTAVASLSLQKGELKNLKKYVE